MAERFEMPSQYGPYRLVGRIGSGGMGTVYEAVDTRLGRLIALKLLHPHIAESPLASSRFLREGRAAARIHHPHVVQVLALGSEEGAPFLAMELLEGLDLGALLEKRGRISVTETLDYALPVIAAVAAAHDAQVVHRDLKPSNVFLGRGPSGRPWPKVVDFGVSAILEGDPAHSTAADGVVGTVAYLSPEQASGKSTGSFEGDQYALAVLLYECVTGERPFKAPSAYETLQAILKAPLVPPSRLAPDVPAAFDKIILRAMNRKPEKRFSSMRAFGTALLPLASERTYDACAAELQGGYTPESGTGGDAKPDSERTEGAGEASSVTATIESARPPPPVVAGIPGLASYDGVATMSRGDTIVILWKSPARSLRARWVFDRVEELIANSPEGIITLMIILPTSAPPDRTAAVESSLRLAKMTSSLRRTAIVVIGDAVWQSIARGVLRVLMPKVGARRLVFAKGIEEGIARALKAAGPKTPSASQLADDVRTLRDALDPTVAFER